MEQIAIYLQNLTLSPTYNDLVVPSKPNCIIYKAENAYLLSITEVEVLPRRIYPFFNSLVFFSRKGKDFKMWSLILYLILCGYHVLAEGKALIVKLTHDIGPMATIKDILHLKIYNRSSGMINRLSLFMSY